ncbi:RrF2 family transcriptional regulator [Paucilactobacillus wasatchensis]|uniref:Putative transcriptional regulator n=1 Tax=Paucilactobacillus wasatchensis TaxID=1335616 RepID=A0A0D0Y513_9LACO|nr:Rrf2 family transcriptional regulator [Paucilactobacillus wasatchensis]KIS03383.1 putative transcriptional regulator [Paucilactobacillus wasatchensis]
MRLDFSVAVHSLLYLDQHRDRRIASRELAQSLDLNSVMIRNILSLLHKNGYVEGSVGKNGGYRLIKTLQQCNIGELYDLTIPPTISYARFITGNNAELEQDDATAIAGNIKETLTDLFTLADEDYRKFYHQFTLADLKNDIEHHGYFIDRIKHN